MKVYIVEAKRSATGSFLGTLKDVKPGDLAGQVIKDLTKDIDNSIVDEVIVGNILAAGHSQGIGRQASIYGGLPESTVAYSINMLCGSGMKAVMNAVSEIKSGEKDIIIAGGVENMSSAPFLVSSKARAGLGLGETKLVDSMSDALVDAFEGYHMGITAENIAQKFNITRDMQDEYAIDSQRKAILADDAQKFVDEITPITIKTRKGDIVFDKDEYINRNTSLEKLQKLRPAFKKDGTVTAGNASGINDGASFTLIASEEAVKKYNLTPLAEIVDVSQVGIDPSVMGLSPAYAIEKLLKKTDVSIDDIDLFEINEAFAAQVLGVFELLKEKVQLNDKTIQEKININGSGIALGHPVGASANRIIVSLVHQMQKQDSNYGLASLCIGGGMGTAILLKKVK
ncbi:acetyl-CoA C-acyltransferase [Poseidonibacter ostreae]|mgnify:CR=1 FL=1|jgi:acetyl-CoA C-acetyltransferase|uniref:acetyl-CoA C-acetyltransferase n=1 Tax=Poseidonibacter ostreae TaxID=2654171 RepID=UPI0012653B96|nr:acetyl-CoA C-acetyltransferase [Poseidonibacter ostreae]KAB7887736.1 acetyl-CoA C-acyltransferase [Poseidonibacter ostreae]